jgi:hypothetical protein
MKEKRERINRGVARRAPMEKKQERTRERKRGKEFILCMHKTQRRL